MSQQNEQQKFSLIEYAHRINLKSIDYTNERRLIKYRTKCQCYHDSIKYTVEFLKIALQGTFLLNGAGLIPIIYSKVDYFYNAGMWFAAGAGVSVLAACATFAYQDLVTQTWHKAVFKTYASSRREAYEPVLFGWKILRDRPLLFRVCASFLVAASLILFCIGLYQAGMNVDISIKSEEKVLAAPTPKTPNETKEGISNSPQALCHACESAHRIYHSNQN